MKVTELTSLIGEMYRGLSEKDKRKYDEDYLKKK